MVKRYHPKYATVPDLSEQEVKQADIARAIKQYEALQPYCEIPLIVPKLPGQMALLPDEMAVGYSVPTSYGGAQYPIWELMNRRVHLLGGSPHEQMNYYRYISAIAEVISVDGNMAQKMAIQFAKFWQKGKWVEHPEHGRRKADIYLDCWKRSCANIRQKWQEVAR